MTTDQDKDSDDDYEGGQEKEDSINVKSVGKDIVGRKVEDLSQEISLLKPHYPTKVGYIPGP